MRNPFRRRSAAELSRQYKQVDARRVAYVTRKGLALTPGKLDRRERRYQRQLGRIVNRRHKAIQRGR